ncbi:MAG: CapA family protein [Kordiimonadaceae bacterium]|nr:CapA family protein [Kordiimonadaceae bacterium]
MNKEIKLGFVGDFCLAGIHLKPRSYLENIYEVSSSLNDQVDLAMANHEFCILPSGNENIIEMGLSAENMEDIKKAGFDIFCLANNHIGDFGSQAIIDTKEFLEKHGCMAVGVGKNREEAIEPLITESNGFRVAVVNFCDATQYAAGKNSIGLAHIEKKLLTRSISKARKNADIVIVVLHADLEYTNYPSPARVKLARQLAELGPDIIIQHHPHVLQGIEYYGNTLIAYSLGNFVFPVNRSDNRYKNRENACKSIYLSVHLKEDREGKREMTYDVVPVQIDKQNNTFFPEKEMSEAIKADLKRYSEALADDKFLRENYYNECRKQMRDMVYDIYYRTAKRGIVAGFKYLKIHLETKSHTNWIRGYFTFGRY